MKTRNKILIAICLLVLLFLASLCVACLYLYHNPSAAKPFIERAVSRTTETTCTIKTLSYSLKPLSLRASGITLRPLGSQQGLYLDVSDLRALMDLVGPFGHRTLTFKSLNIEGFSSRFSEKAIRPGMKLRERRPSFFARILKGAVALFLFQDVAFQEAKAVKGHVTAESENIIVKANDIHAALNSERQISISGSLQMKSTTQNLNVHAPHVHLSTDGAISLLDPVIKATLTAKNATFQSPQMGVENMQAKAELTYSHKQKLLFFKPAYVHLEDLTLKQLPHVEWSAMSLQLKIEGLFSIQERKLKVSMLDLNLNNTHRLKADLDMIFKDHAEFRLRVLESHFLAQEMIALLPDRQKRGVSPISLSGPINLHGTVNGLRDEQKWRLACDLDALLKKNQITYKLGRIRVSSSVSGTIGAKGRLPDVDITAKLEGERTLLSGVGIQPEPFNVGLYLSGKHPVYRIRDLSFKIPGAKVRVGNKDILVEQIQLQTRKGRIDGKGKVLFVPGIRFDSSLLKNLLIALELDRRKLNLQIQGEDAHLLESAIALKLLPPDWQLGGKDSFQLNALLNENGDWTFTSEFRLQDLGFQNQDGRYMGEKISLRVRTDGKLDRKNAQIDAKSSLKLDQGEVLLDRYYLDLNRSPFLSFMEGEYDLSRKALKLSSLGLQLKDILDLALKGTVHFPAREPHLHLSIHIPRTPLEPLFHHFVLEPFKTEKPFLTSLKLGGTVAADLNLLGTLRDWVAKGHYQWHGGEFSSTEGHFAVAEIDLDLPIWLQSEGKNEALEAKRKRLEGTLSIGSFFLPPLPEQPLRFALEASPNGLSVPSPTLLNVPGGRVELGPVVCNDIYGSQRAIETSVTLDAVKLDPLLTGIWPQPVTGTLEGALDPVYLKGHALHTKGDIMAKVFGGEILVSGLGASGLFTPTPLFKLSAIWKDLRLADLTGGTSFGKIEGILKGYVKDLEIAYGQPQRFDLLLETVKKKGIRQRMSQRAVDSIAQIGGGQSPFMGVAGMVTSIFEEFPYKKIGIRASLENDVFRINGTIKEGGTEYYVKGTGIPVINIVNVNPDNQIRFKDMVKRIRRVTTSKRGPVVK